MKNLILIFISVLLVGCESTGPKVTTDDEKSQAILSAYDGYLANEYSWDFHSFLRFEIFKYVSPLDPYFQSYK